MSRRGMPRIVVAHSDVVSWWVAVHGHEPEESPWIRWYRETVTRGLDHADVVVAPSQWMLNTSSQATTSSPRCAWLFITDATLRSSMLMSRKNNLYLTVGRFWDRANRSSILLKREHDVPVWIAGSQQEPGHRADSRHEAPSRRVHSVGEQSQEQLQQLFSRAGIYAATSCYEPFGLAPLEAAFLELRAGGMNDLPAFHEIVGGCARITSNAMTLTI